MECALSHSLFLDGRSCALDGDLAAEVLAVGAVALLTLQLEPRLPVLYSNLLVVEPTVAFFSRALVAFAGAGLLLTTRPRAELKRSAKEASYLYLLSFLFVIIFNVAVGCLLREGRFCLPTLFLLNEVAMAGVQCLPSCCRSVNCASLPLRAALRDDQNLIEIQFK